jgi:hypothetical protein
MGGPFLKILVFHFTLALTSVTVRINGHGDMADVHVAAISTPLGIGLSALGRLIDLSSCNLGFAFLSADVSGRICTRG